jgi:dipicolinate synthase subunit B
MTIKSLNIGFAITGSFCTIPDIIGEIKRIANEGGNVIPIFSENVCEFETRFTNPEKLRRQIEEITGSHIIDTIPEAEPIGPKKLLDVLVIAPCTGNTLAKIANAITDTSVTMAAKGHLRNERPLVISVASNDALSGNAKNIGTLLTRKNVYFVPFYQDDPIKKPRSLQGKNSLLIDTILEALKGKQIQPILALRD